MKLLDEATAAAAGGELATERAMDVYCILITACERVRDFARVHEWARRVMDAASEDSNEDFLTFARTEFAHVLVRTGHWEEAERHLRLITDDPEARPLSAAMAYVFLADLFVRRGDLDQADQLLSVAEREPWRRGVRHLVMASRAALHLAEGRPQDAADLARRYLRAVQPEAVAERLDGAMQAADELTAISDTIETAGVRAAARQAIALVAAVRGDLDAALEAAWDARELYETAQMHPDVVGCQVEIAGFFRSSGDTARAGALAEQARAAAHDLGALSTARAATEVLEGLRAAQGGPAELTAREVEVLSQVADGATNQQIADRLVLSVRTIERHLSNIYLKLGATGPSARAIATSYAHRHRLT
jgi:ATP/maltotriose-dependent transcriptional regulator MalT